MVVFEGVGTRGEGVEGGDLGGGRGGGEGERGEDRVGGVGWELCVKRDWGEEHC